MPGKAGGVSRDAFLETRLMVVDKSARILRLVESGETVASFPVRVGRNPGAKEREGDGRTPEGAYFLLRLLPDEAAVGTGHYKGLHLSYPSLSDTARGRATGLIDDDVLQAVTEAYREGGLPPQETALGGYVAIHAGLADDADADAFAQGTHGCIVLRNRDMDIVYAFARAGMPVFLFL